MRKNMRQNTEEKRVQKIKDTISSSKKLTTEDFEFVCAKNSYVDEEKKVKKKEEKKNEIKNKRERRKMS